MFRQVSDLCFHARPCLLLAQQVCFGKIQLVGQSSDLGLEVQNLQLFHKIGAFLDLVFLFLIGRKGLADLLQVPYFHTGILDLLPHAPVLHHTLLHILNVDIHFHADIFFHKILQLDIHAKGNGAFEQKRKFLRIQPAQIGIVKDPAKPFIMGGCKALLFVVVGLKV